MKTQKKSRFILKMATTSLRKVLSQCQTQKTERRGTALDAKTVKLSQETEGGTFQYDGLWDFGSSVATATSSLVSFWFHK